MANLIMPYDMTTVRSATTTSFYTPLNTTAFAKLMCCKFQSHSLLLVAEYIFIMLLLSV